MLLDILAYDRDAGGVGGVDHFLFVEHQGSPGFHGEDGGARLLHHRNRVQPDHGDVEQEMLAAARYLDHRHAPAIDQRGGAAQHGVGALHGLHGHTGAFANGDSLSHVEAGQRIGHAAAVFDIRQLFLGRLAARHHAGGGQQGLEQRGGIAQLNAFVGQNLNHAADQAIGILCREGGEQLKQTPVGGDGGEDFGMLHLAAHHDLGDAILLADLDHLAELAEGDPVAARGERLHFLGSFFLDGDDRDREPKLACAFQREQREAAVAGDQSVACHGSHLLYDTALAGADELEEFIHFGVERHLGANAFDGLAGIELGPGEQAEGSLQRFDHGALEPAAFQANAVGAEDADLALAHGGGVWQHVLNDHAVGADEGVAADAAELMDAGEGADVGPIADGDVAGEGDAVGHNDVIADQRVVGDVGVGHEQVVAADGGDQSPALCAAMDGDEFADAVAVANAGLGALALVLEVLRGHAGGAVGEEEVVLADRGGAFEVVIGHQARARADVDFRSDDAIGADIGAGFDFRREVDDGGGMNRHRSGNHFGGRLLFLVGEFAHDFGFGDDYAIHGGHTGHLGHAGFALEDLHLHAQGVAGHHGAAEARGFDGHQEHQFIGAVRHIVEHQDARRLGHGLHDEHAGHDRKIREMAGDLGLVGGDALDADDAIGLHLDDAVDQKKWVAMGQDGPNLVNVQNRHGSLYYRMLGQPDDFYGGPADMSQAGTLCSARELFVPVQASAQEHFDVGLVADPFIGGQASRPVDVASGDSQHDFL